MKLLKRWFSRDIVRLYDPNFGRVPSKIWNNYKYWPHFKNCIGAINDTHIPCVVSEEDKIPYIGRKGYPTQNILAICVFDMLFTYLVARWPGSIHDNRILKNAIEDINKAFPHPPKKVYYHYVWIIVNINFLKLLFKQWKTLT